jgi:DNA-binding NarL/FixJ family response regulator
VRVLLVDDHALVRRGLTHVVTTYVEGAEVTQAAGADEAVEALRRLPHDVVLVDVRMPGRDGIDLLTDIHSTWPDLPVIILTNDADEQHLVAALRGGAAGYVLKDSSPEDLAGAIMTAMSGSSVVVSALAVSNLAEAFAQPVDKEEPESPLQLAGLTPREREVLQLLTEGATNQEISRRLLISEKTVKAHLAGLFRKLDVQNRTQAALFAVGTRVGA